MKKYFGTDGIRGIAKKRFTPDFLSKLAIGLSKFLNDDKKRIIIAKDTRISGDAIMLSLASMLVHSGFNVDFAGVLPTPAIPKILKNEEYSAGIVITASHNPFEYNGIKIFNKDGFKLTDEIEEEIEKIIDEDNIKIDMLEDTDFGKFNNKEEYFREKYISLIISETKSLENKKIALDLANGAASFVGEDIFTRLGGIIKVYNNNPDGTNINKNCGSTDLSFLKNEIIKLNNEIKDGEEYIGLAFDGDADRLLVIDEEGEEISGDILMGIISKYLKELNLLKNNKIAITVMTNIGLKRFLEKENIEFTETKVGDRYVLEEMLKQNLVFGGEQSGHMIFLDRNVTGDGIASGLLLLESLKYFNKTLKEMKKEIIIYPQILVNVKIKEERKGDIFNISEINKKIDEVTEILNKKGRVLIRASGTEPLVRVMLEGENIDELTIYANEIAKMYETEMGDNGK